MAGLGLWYWPNQDEAKPCRHPGRSLAQGIRSVASPRPNPTSPRSTNKSKRTSAWEATESPRWDGAGSARPRSDERLVANDALD